MHAFADGLHLARCGLGRDALRWLAAGFAAVALLAFSYTLQSPAGSQIAPFASTEMLVRDRGWQPVDPRSLELPRRQVSLLRARINLAPSVIKGGQPLGLYLSGSFSADAAWNGVSIGHKGRPGASRAAELPGPIDAVLSLPAGALRAGENVLVLRLSSERLASGQSIIHGTGPIFGLRLAPFSADPRRPIGYYAAPLLLSVLLFVALVSTMARGKLRSPATIILAGLLICALAELSRSIVNYPYQLHGLRMSLVTMGALALGFGCVLRAQQSAEWLLRPWWWALGSAGMGLLAVALQVGATNIILASTLIAALIGGYSAIQRRDRSRARWPASLLFLATFSFFSEPDFMDQGLYAGSVPLIAELLWRRRLPKRKMPTSSLLAASLVVGPSGARRFLDLHTIQAIRAAGDYVEISFVNGRQIVECEAISALAERLPADFLRVHRSHIVNLVHITELRSEGGGRYRLRIGEKLWVPVARTRISDLRARLGY